MVSSSLTCNRNAYSDAGPVCITANGVGRATRVLIQGRPHLAVPVTSLLAIAFLLLSTTVGLGRPAEPSHLDGVPHRFVSQGSLRSGTTAALQEGTDMVVPHTVPRAIGRRSANDKTIYFRWLTKETRWLTGVYAWVNMKNGKVYVGSGAGQRGIGERYGSHLKALRNGCHSNRHLQAAWNKYGESAFVFTSLEFCPAEDCISREQFWLDELQAAKGDYGYNLSPTAGNNLGIIYDPEIKAKLAEATRKCWTGRKHTEEAKAKQAEYARNRPPEARANLSAAAKRKKLTEEHKRKISEAGKGKTATLTARKKRSEFMKNFWANVTPERRKEIGRKSAEQKRLRRSSQEGAP